MIINTSADIMSITHFKTLRRSKPFLYRDLYGNPMIVNDHFVHIWSPKKDLSFIPYNRPLYGVIDYRYY